MAGIYIHIPYCVRKCIYCDFYSVGARRAPWSELVDALRAELQMRLPELEGEPVNTIYIGGGTPSLMPDDEFRRLAKALPRADCEEFTVEVNPDDVTSQLIDTYLAAGVNRVSMGVQTLTDAELLTIGRRHTARQALEAYERLRRVGNVSIDLMFGLPGQTLESWESTVSRAVALAPEHVSAYSLMWEEGTALSVMRRQGRVEEAPDELSVQMYDLLREHLMRAGFEHYEISNYARRGRASRHNSSYWQGVPYLGLGPGAHSYDGRACRRANPCDTQAYISAYTSTAPTPFYDTELLTPEQLREEYIMTRLRTAAGIDLADFERRFGSQSLRRLLRAARPHLLAGHLRQTPATLCLTADAVLILDAVTVDLL